MATDMALRLGIIEGDLVIFLRAAEAMTACDIVELMPTSGGYFQKCGTSGVPFGVVAETVTATGVYDYEPGGMVSHTAKVGDLVGVYINGGVYNHINATSGVYGVEVYAGTTTAGKLATAASSNATKVGIVIESKDATTGICKFKSYL